MKLFTPAAHAPVSRLAAGAVLLLAVAGTVGATSVTSAMEPAAHRTGTNVLADDPWTVAPAAKADDPWT